MPARYMALNPIRTITPPPHDHVAPQPLLFSSPTLSLSNSISLFDINSIRSCVLRILFISRACRYLHLSSIGGSSPELPILSPIQI